jgi:hypothetical protein
MGHVCFLQRENQTVGRCEPGNWKAIGQGNITIY